MQISQVGVVPHYFSMFLCYEINGFIMNNCEMIYEMIDLFDPSLGEVKAVCHINFMVEANWLFNQTIKAGLE